MALQDLTIPVRETWGAPGLSSIQGGESLVVLALHGFGSNKESDTIARLAKALAGQNQAVLAADLPGHGQHVLDGAGLTMDNCLAQITAMEQMARQLAPQARIGYFGSSFGGYLTLLYLSQTRERPGAGERPAFLRCAATTMPQLLQADVTPQIQADFQRQGYHLLTDCARPLALYPALLADLAAHDLFRLPAPAARLSFIHGDADEEVPLADVQRYCARISAPLTVVARADHRFTGPGQMEQVLAAATAFFGQG